MIRSIANPVASLFFFMAAVLGCDDGRSLDSTPGMGGSGAVGGDGSRGQRDDDDGHADGPRVVLVPTAPELVTYRLVELSAIASPLPDPDGIAADATGLWILNGGHNSNTNTLVHFDPKTGTTDRTFSFTT